MNVEQTVSTRNQSTANFSTGKLFIFDNRYKEGVFKNITAGVLEHQGGNLVVRSKTIANGFEPATADNLADVVGVSAFCGSKQFAAGETANINIGTKGTIDGNLLELPTGVTLNTVVGNKTLTDILEDLGLHVDTSAVEHTKFDN